MNRVHLSAIALAACLVACSISKCAERMHPNIVVILADDLGYGDVQALNPQRGKIATPHMDRLVREGLSFNEAHSGSSVCTPTRYGLLSGRYAWRTRLQRGVFDDYLQPLIAPERLTLPRMLQQAGYATACVGKWHLGFTIAGEGEGEKKKRDPLGAPLGAITNDGPLTRGFDRFAGFHHARMMRSFFEQDRVTRFVDSIDMLPLLSDEATAFIAAASREEKPYFLYLPLSAPHTPIVPAHDWQGASKLNAYADFVMQTDSVVGRVLDAIDRSGEAASTLVILTSDNGCSTAADVKFLEKQGHFASELRRGYKTEIWDGGHRVPLVVRWPAKIPAARKSDAIVGLSDLFETCRELVGAQRSDTAGEDSVSFLPLLESDQAQAARSSIVHHSAGGRFAIREGNWKLCLAQKSDGQNKRKQTSRELYDLQNDLGETTNVAEKHPEIVARLAGMLESFVAQGRSTPGTPQRNDVEVKVE